MSANGEMLLSSSSTNEFSCHDGRTSSPSPLMNDDSVAVNDDV